MLRQLFDQEGMGELARHVWKRGGLDTLVKVLPIGTALDPPAAIGLCTVLKFVAGRTPEEMKPAAGLAGSIAILSAVEVFRVTPLPDAGEFELTGYAPADGLAPDPPGYLPHPFYPPGRGAPQWSLFGVPQARLVRIAGATRGQRLMVEPRSLLPIA